MKITFLNHASYHVELSDSQLIFDPWFEGQVFDGGWSLLDNSFNSERVIDFLKSKNKKTYVVVSHEHPDHFNVPFIFKLKKLSSDITFIIQKTNDGRVNKFLKSQGFETIVLDSNERHSFSNNECIRIFKVGRIDSYSILKSKDKELINLNDCVFENTSDIKKISSNLENSEPLVFTQFGYASHIGLKNDSRERVIAAQEKINFLDDINNIISPERIIPFASFCYFCREDNYFLNDHQNTPKILIKNLKKETMQRTIFLKPFDTFRTDETSNEDLNKMSLIAVNHWTNLSDEKKILRRDSEDDITEEKLKEIADSFTIYKKKIFKSAPLMTLLLFIFGYLRKIDIEVIELKSVLRFSYFDEVEILNTNSAAMKFNFHRLLHLIKNEFGLDTMQIGGQFDCNSFEEINKVSRFFTLQNIVKNKYNFSYVLKSAFKKIPLIE